MDFYKSCSKCYLHEPKHSGQFLEKSMQNFYFYFYLNIIFVKILKYYHYLPLFKCKWVKNRPEILLRSIKANCQFQKVKRKL